eukprot:gene5692-11481_t
MRYLGPLSNFKTNHNSESDIDISSRTTTIVTSDNLRMELLFSGPRKQKNRMPLIFIHGAGGGAWVFQEHWLPFFAKLGYECYAVGLRGSFGSGLPPKDTSTAVTLTQHISDLKTILQVLKKKHRNMKPIILGHSFGGLVVTKLLEDDAIRSLVSGAAWICALPPTGQGKMATRFLFTRFISTVNIIRGFAFGQVRRPALNRLIFYDDSISDNDLIRYMNRLQLDSKIGQNFTDVGNNLPIIDAKTGLAPWLSSPLISGNLETTKSPLKRLVMGSINDYIVDPPAIIENAKYFGVEPVLIRGPGHNVMLGGRWEVAASAVLNWLRSEFPSH